MDSWPPADRVRLALRALVRWRPLVRVPRRFYVAAEACLAACREARTTMRHHARVRCISGQPKREGFARFPKNVVKWPEWRASDSTCVRHRDGHGGQERSSADTALTPVTPHAPGIYPRIVAEIGGKRADCEGALPLGVRSVSRATTHVSESEMCQ